MRGKFKRAVGRVRITPATVIATVALIVALGGVAYSAVPGPDGQIYACYLIDPDPDFSYLYITEHNVDCQPGEKRITWSQQGADQSQVAAAATAAGGINPNLLKQLSAQLTETTKKLAAALPPKIGIQTTKVLKGFKGKQDKSLGTLLKEIKTNDRKQARYNALMRQMFEGVQKLNAQAANSQVSIDDTIQKLIKSVRIGL